MGAGMAPAVIVTRPAREAAAWVQALTQRNILAAALPLIEIGPAPDSAALDAARASLPGCDAAMFVSANAVEGLLRGPGDWPALGPRAWATGPGTAAALVRAGVAPDRIDQPAADAPSFDSEALWSLVERQLAPGARVLIVRGADGEGTVGGRRWLAERLHAAGLQVTEVASYVRRRPAWGAHERQLMADAATAWWLFSSSEAIGHLRELAPSFDPGGARALCTHARIARAAQEARFGRVAQVHPSVDAVAAFLQSGA